MATTGLAQLLCGEEQQPTKKHLVTLSFDDGFTKSSIRTAKIYEKHKLSACLNVVASAHMKDFRPPDYPELSRADFGLWNDLAARGHEIMPHGYRRTRPHAITRQKGSISPLRPLHSIL